MSELVRPALDWLEPHESGTFARLTQGGTYPFA
jgi:hypothetical protein